MAKRRFKKLKDRMYEKELTQDEAARMLGRSTTYLSHRLNGHEPFDFADAAVLAGVLDIPRTEWADYFTEATA